MDTIEHGISDLEDHFGRPLTKSERLAFLAGICEGLLQAQESVRRIKDECAGVEKE